VSVDPYASEPAVQIPPDLWTQYQQAVENAEGWNRHVKFLREQIEKLIGDAHAGKVGDRKVVTYRPIDTWSVTGLKRDYPEMVQHFEHEVARTEFDLKSFAAQHPDIAEQYRSRQFRAVVG